MVKLDLLKCFIAAADTGSFSAAGRLLGKHLATVSGNIARLEDELGLLLFDREGKYPQLTEAGINLYDSAKVIVDSVERFTLSANQLSAGVPAKLTVAIDEDLGIAAFASVFQACQQQWPHLRMTLLLQSSQHIFEQVKAQQVDLAITPSLEGNSQFYDFKAVGHCDVNIVCSQRHPLARKRQVSNDDLMAYTQVVSQSIRQNESLYQAVKMSPAMWFCNGFQAMVQLLQADVGWSFLFVSREALPEGLVCLSPEFVHTQMQLQYDVIWQKNQPLSEVHHFILDNVKQVFAKQV